VSDIPADEAVPENADTAQVRAAWKRELRRRAELEDQLQTRVAAEAEARRDHDAQVHQMEAEHAATVGRLRRELTFTKAGVDLDSVTGATFAATFEGAETDPIEVARHYARFLDASAREARRYANSQQYAATHTVNGDTADADR
jgi:hypothetical protein